MTFTTFLFDLDGTLIDSVDLILSSYRHTLSKHRREQPPDALWLRGLGTPLWAQFREFTSDDGEIHAMIATYREHNLANHDAMVRNYDGVREALDVLHARGRFGVVTSKTNAGARRGLACCGLDDLFEVIIGADDVARHKPEPDPVLAALDLMHAAPRDAVFVGDSPHDMAAGRAAGVHTAAALWGPFARSDLEPHAPDYWLTTPRDIATTLVGDGYPDHLAAGA